MKKYVFGLIGLLLTLFVYYALPVYQGLAYRGKVPMLTTAYIDWPKQQPAKSHLHQTRFASIEAAALEALKAQQESVSAPGYTVAVAIDGIMAWSASVGWADIANKKEMTVQTTLRIGSTSKALTATGLARLVAEGKLDLDAPLSHYFAELPHPDWGKITARHLASHMSGLPHYRRNEDTLGLIASLGAQGQYDDVLEAVGLFDSSALLFEPGEEFSYSSWGTVLLSALIQIKSEQTYQHYIQEAVLAPLQMQSTRSKLKATGEAPTEIKTAQFYWQDPQQNSKLKPWYSLNLSHRLAGGGWLSTSQDLARLGQGFMNKGFLPEDVRQQFWTAQKLNNGELNPQHYGLGWRVHELTLGDGFKPVMYMHHGGVSAGAQSFLLVIPEYKLSMAINANIRTKVFSDFAKVSKELLKLFIGEIERPKRLTQN